MEPAQNIPNIVVPSRNIALPSIRRCLFGSTERMSLFSSNRTGCCRPHPSPNWDNTNCTHVSYDAAQRFARTPFRPGNHVRGAITLHGAGTLMPHAQPKFGVSSRVAIANNQEPAIRDRIVWLFRQRTDAHKI